MKKKSIKQAGEKRGKIALFGIMIALIFISINAVSAATNATNCQTLSSAGETYTLNASISNDTITTDCMIISSEDK